LGCGEGLVMPEITLVKTSDSELTEVERNALNALMFGGMFDGLSQDDKRSWRRFWKSMLNLSSGEICSIETWMPRIGGFHRMHMLMETRVYQSQERIASFEQFRYWLKIGAGFVDWMAGAKGGVVPVPRSISYKKCDEDAMREFHRNVVDFLKSTHATKYLWPHLDNNAGTEMIHTVLEGFENGRI
jgi:hypothetical protein